MKSSFLAFTLLSLAFSAIIPPEANQNFTQIVGGLGYPVETHHITTTDGYINTYFRIQAKNTKIKPGLPVIYCQHGLLDSSDSWIMNDEALAPGLILANAGYDVWIGNIRGNRYSLGHTIYNSSDFRSPYWDFSWQEMSIYDLPAAFIYINNITGQQINYIGHSQGTCIMFAALARRDPVILKYLKHYIALGPVAYVDHTTSPIIHLIDVTDIGGIILVTHGKKFLFLSQTEKTELELLCTTALSVCIEQIKLFADVHPEVDNTKKLNIFVGHFPAGTSTQNMEYWDQMSKDKEYRMFDYGKAGNLKHYNQTTPPLIPLKNINVPVHLFSGAYDELADPTDVARLASELTGSPNVTFHTYQYGHLTFLVGLDVSYIKDVLAILNS